MALRTLPVGSKCECQKFVLNPKMEHLCRSVCDASVVNFAMRKCWVTVTQRIHAPLILALLDVVPRTEMAQPR